MLCIDQNLMSSSDAALSIASWIQSQKIKILNFAGPRASDDAGIYGDMFRILAMDLRMQKDGRYALTIGDYPHRREGKESRPS